MEAGFAGVRVRTLGEASSVGHLAALALYRFPDGTELPYLEISEVHPWYKGERRLPLSEVVHALLNLGEMELFQIGSRERDYCGVLTVPE